MLRRKYDVVNRDAAGFISRRTEEEDREEEHFPLVSVRFAASSHRVAEELRRRQKTHASRGKEREKKIKNKAHSQHEFHEESDEPKHDETCVGEREREREKREKKRTVSATPKEGKAPFASMTTTTTTSGKKKKKKKKKFESSDRSFVGGAVYI